MAQTKALEEYYSYMQSEQWHICLTSRIWPNNYFEGLMAHYKPHNEPTWTLLWNHNSIQHDCTCCLRLLCSSENFYVHVALPSINRIWWSPQQPTKRPLHAACPWPHLALLLVISNIYNFSYNASHCQLVTKLCISPWIQGESNPCGGQGSQTENLSASSWRRIDMRTSSLLRELVMG